MGPGARERQTIAPSRKHRRRAKPPTPAPARVEFDANASIWWLLPVLLLATLVAYSPALHGSLLWDDNRHITRAALRSLGGLSRIWSDLRATQQYYPVTHSVFWIEHRLWGDDTFGYHIVNVVLHACSAYLVAMILRRLAVPGAVLAAVVFALHPVHVESVAWMTELKNTLSGVFALASALAYLRFDERREPRAYVSALVLFLLALLSKTVTAPLPGALLVIAWWRRGRIDLRRDVLPLVPLFAAGAAAGLVTVWLERTMIGASGNEFGFSFLERCLIAGRAMGFYVGTLLWPSNLIFNYPRWGISLRAWWQYLYPLAAIAAAGGLWRLRSRTRAPLAAMLLFCGMLFPVLGFFNVYPFKFSFVADHFVYLASIPVIALGAAALASLAERWSVTRKTAAFGVVALGGGLALLTFHQSRAYASAETLYRDTLARNPASFLAHDNLGVLTLDTQPEEALAHLNEAIRLNPDVAEAHDDRGVALQRMGRLEEAVREYREALRLLPTFPGAHNNLANALLALGRPEEAAAASRAALRLDPDFLDAHYNLGLALITLDRPEASEEFEAAIHLQPDFAEAHYYLGVGLRRAGRRDEALVQYADAARLGPGLADAHFSLADLLQEMGRYTEAVPHYEDALRLAPNSPLAHNNLGAALEALGRLGDAAAQYREALRLDPGSQQTRENLARLSGR